jgi:hypothetical protein
VLLFLAKGISSTSNQGTFIVLLCLEAPDKGHSSSLGFNGGMNEDTDNDMESAALIASFPNKVLPPQKDYR